MRSSRAPRPVLDVETTHPAGAGRAVLLREGLVRRARSPVALLAVSLLVQKFGGTSVADPERIREVADHVARTVRHGNDVVVVVSAMGKETDELIRLAGDVSEVRPGREMDMLITAGERKATALLCMALHSIGVRGRQLHGQPGRASSPTPTTPTPRSSSCAPTGCARRSRLAGCRWSAARRACRPTTTSPSWGGAAPTPRPWPGHALGGDACELYTDVPGVFTADPRLVPGARRLAAISFDEMLEMMRHRVPQAGHAVGGVRPALGRGAARPLGLHLGAGHLGHRGGPRPWNRRSSRP